MNGTKSTTLSGIAFLAAALFYGLSAGAMRFEQSIAPHYIHLADAFLHRQTHIADVGLTLDIIHYADKLYVPSPPMPAVLLMPFVALFGATFSDILFSVLLGALNVTLVQHLFRNRWLTLFFAIGTPHLYFSALGSVWFQAQATAILCCLLAIWASREHQRPFLAGLCWMCALLARPPVALGAFLPFYLLDRKSEQRNVLSTTVRFALPLLFGLIVFGAYNQVRFEDWREFGYRYMVGAPNIVATIEQHGTFSLRYAPCNLRVSLLSQPVFYNHISEGMISACRHLLPSGAITLPAKPVQPNPIGMSLFIASPLFLLLPFTLFDWRNNWFLWLSLLAVMLLNWLVHNTGSLQFGYRYWMDAAPMWLLLLATLSEQFMQNEGSRFPKKLFVGLTLLSIAINLWGFSWMYESFVGQNWFALWR